MAQPNYPPFPWTVSQPLSHNPGEQPTYTQPPLGYPPIPSSAKSPPMTQPAYPPAPPPTNYPPVQEQMYPPVSLSQPNAPPMTQPTYPPAPPPTPYPPVQEQIYPPVSLSQPNAPPMTQPTYPTAPPPAPFPPVQEQIFPPVSLSQPSYPPVPQSSHSAPPHPQPSYAYTVPPVPPAPTPQPSHSAITIPMPVLGPQYCLPRIVDLAIVRKLVTLTDDFVVTDVKKNLMFKVKGKFFTLHDKRVLLDAAGNSVLTLRQKILTAHSRWQAFRGGSKDPRDLIFTAKTSSIIQLKTKLNVYLANRTTEDVSDFKLEGSWSESSCVIYVGESTTIAAKMEKKETAESHFLGKDTFMVTVYPNIDYAFVVALIVILDAINSNDDS